jgi:hypothetical protein
MSIFTGRELEFLAGLNKSWWTLYWRELARLSVNAGIERMLGRSYAPPPPAQATDADPAAVVQRRVELAAGNR